MRDTERPNGPDFLADFAEQSLANGLHTNAGEFRQRAADWRADQQRIAELETQVATLERKLRTADDQQRVLADIQNHLQAANDVLAGATAAA